MKILMFGWEFAPQIAGGLGTASKGLTWGLAEKGHDVIFVLPHSRQNYMSETVRFIDAGRYYEEQMERQGRPQGTVSFHPIESPLQPYQNEKTYAVGQQSWSVLRVPGHYAGNLVAEVQRYALAALGIAADEDFDVIHAHDWMTFEAAVAVKRATGKPLVVHVHSTEYDRSGDAINWAIYHVEKSGMDAADRIIAVSQRVRDQIIQRYHQAPEKIVVVYNAVDKEPVLDKASVRKALNEKFVLFLGRVTSQKGPEYFLEAAARVLKTTKNVRFIMAGAGDLLPRMIEEAARLRLQNNFHFTGFLGAHERDELFAMSDVFVMPSVSEPFGITPLEAMKYGVPVIISRQSGVSEILPHAIKVDFWDVDELSDRIVELLTKPRKAKSVVEKGTEALKLIDWQFVADRLVGLYRTLVGAK
ncbi:MAG: glycosyltransferase family 4 protein [Spirochaetes bacterium]|nr:glycosyltransferase family 4 protein [Spirochaetota bacterium]